MRQVVVYEQSLSDIADAIRAKNGETKEYKPNEMAAAIEAISGGGLGNENVSVVFNITSSTSTYRPIITYLYYDNNNTLRAKSIIVSTNSYSSTLDIAKGSYVNIASKSSAAELSGVTGTTEIDIIEALAALIAFKANGAGTITGTFGNASGGGAN